MLVYRLIRFRDDIPDLDVGVRRRNKELCKPYIRLFYGSQSQREIEQTFQTFLDAKSDKKSTSLEAILIPIICDLVEKNGNDVLSMEIWEYVKQNLEGEINPYDPNGYQVSGYTLYKNTITKLLEDKFGASYRHTEKGGKILFNLDKLQKVQRSYDTEAIIKTTPKNVLEYDPDGTDGILENATPSEEASDDDMTAIVYNNNHENNKNVVNISQNEGLGDLKEPPTVPQEPSEPSEPSGSSLSELSEEKKAELRVKYDAAREKIRRISE